MMMWILIILADFVVLAMVVIEIADSRRQLTKATESITRIAREEQNKVTSRADRIDSLERMIEQPIDRGPWLTDPHWTNLTHERREAAGLPALPPPPTRTQRWTRALHERITR